MANHGVTQRELYEFWKRYVEYNLHFEGNSQKALAQLLDVYHMGRYHRLMGYFAALALDGLTVDFFKEVGS